MRLAMDINTVISPGSHEPTVPPMRPHCASLPRSSECGDMTAVMPHMVMSCMVKVMS